MEEQHRRWPFEAAAMTGEGRRLTIFPGLGSLAAARWTKYMSGLQSPKNIGELEMNINMILAHKFQLSSTKFFIYLFVATPKEEECTKSGNPDRKTNLRFAKHKQGQ